ncbi:phage portal protein [Frigoribacterium sp. CFBP9030]|uniref:phage portal protein n=1 Tax=Frigoribacterium sp. CFBP9030 TaxID=3096537 RepID=UPI002A69DD48|nr:phage portal protein [Frigoribacterium sp. CFBP9030]MDY0891871.1 phage portal protein [Frigoribacterium sp. CFBP9030]
MAVMDHALARKRLEWGKSELEGRATLVRRREDYVHGKQDLPFAPYGASLEYEDLREQAPANVLGIAVGAPTQRMRADSIRTNLGEEAEQALWLGAWQANKFDTRQDLIYRSMMIHGRGIASVWVNKANRARPIVRPESYERVHVEMDPDDPFTPLYAVKVYSITERPSNGLILPSSVTSERQVGIVYDKDSMVRFERSAAGGEWVVQAESTHPMRRVPFAVYDYQPDADGRPWSAIDPLMPQQDSLNTIRFNTLLAMQFAAFRQKIVTGFDPRVVDKDGNVLYKTNTDGTPALDANGRMQPLIQSPGRVGVDRMMAFPGADTKVFDLEESNLANYVDVWDMFLTTFFSTAQIPPQYQLGQMVNLSGDALTAAESTLASLVKELQLSAGEGHEDMLELAYYASGGTEDFLPTSETEWLDAEARSFSQVVDGVQKLITTGFPRRAAYSMLPGATTTRLAEWMDQIDEEQLNSRLGQITRPLQDVTATPAPAAIETGGTDGAPESSS